MPEDALQQLSKLLISLVAGVEVLDNAITGDKDEINTRLLAFFDRQKFYHLKRQIPVQEFIFLLNILHTRRSTRK